ncbi:unnamed protein product [Boreogadus saida]
MDEEREEGGPTSKTTLSGEHGRQSKAKRPEQQERADSPGPSCVSMKSDWIMERINCFEPKKVQQQRADSPGPSCVSMKSDRRSMIIPPALKDGRPSREERQQEKSKITSAQSVQHQTELEMNQEELADTLWGGTVGARALSTVGAWALSTVGARALSTVGAGALSTVGAGALSTVGAGALSTVGAGALSTVGAGALSTVGAGALSTVGARALS